MFFSAVLLLLFAFFAHSVWTRNRYSKVSRSKSFVLGGTDHLSVDVSEFASDASLRLTLETADPERPPEYWPPMQLHIHDSGERSVRDPGGGRAAAMWQTNEPRAYTPELLIAPEFKVETSTLVIKIDAPELPTVNAVPCRIKVSYDIDPAASWLVFLLPTWISYAIGVWLLLLIWNIWTWRPKHRPLAY